MKINESCKCGANITVDGQPALCKEMHENFLRIHSICLKVLPNAIASVMYEDKNIIVQVVKKAVNKVRL